jgi:hypothetical protein
MDLPSGQKRFAPFVVAPRPGIGGIEWKASRGPQQAVLAGVEEGEGGFTAEVLAAEAHAPFGAKAVGCQEGESSFSVLR